MILIKEVLYITTIFKTTAALFSLNCGPCREEGIHNYSLCNSHELEDIVNFIEKCSVMGEIHKMWFGVNMLENECVTEYLNGTYLKC